jgi:hypothetical protein
MNKETNNDIDILLRKLSRRDGNALSAAQDGEHAEPEHLDADELNAYAENALPSALRARYTEHLTECTNCRKIVTQLSLASAVLVRERIEETKSSAFKTFIAALFSPLVFRYAVPAMAVVVVVAIAWVALQRRSPSQLARNVSIESQSPQTKNDTSSNISSETEQSKGAISELNKAPARAGEKAQAPPQSPVTKRQEAIEEEKKVAPVGVDNLRDREDQSRRYQQQPVAPATTSGAGASAAAPASPTPKPDVAAERSLAAAQKKESEADKNKAMNEQQTRTTSSGPQKSPDVQASPKVGAVDSAERRSTLRESRAKDEAESGEVRTVGGHRFRKRGDVWIDTLYSSQRITNVSRGSEQYRALVADEPGIRSIAEGLKTEFIVVWNGRAYFIK